MNIIYFILVGIIAGWLAGLIRKGKGFGLLGNMVVGILGAIFGGFLFSILGITAYGLLGQIILATIGALLLLSLLSFINIGKSRR